MKISEYPQKTVWNTTDIIDVSTIKTLIGGSLTVGKVYTIAVNTTGDFENVGASDNLVGTSFTATGTTPTAWGDGELTYYITEKTTASDFIAKSTGLKRYKALLSQVGTEAPTVVSSLGSEVNVPFENTIGNIIFSYVSPGRYHGTLPNAFPNKQKTNLMLLINNNGNNALGYIYYGTLDYFIIDTMDLTETYADDILNDATLLIEVYE